jgi:RND family efflux transporter MFP subunit
MHLFKITALIILFVTTHAHAQTTVKSVVISTPQQIENSNSLVLTGSFNPTQHSALSTRVDGLITKLFVDVGDYVEQGDKLITLDPALTQFSIKEQTALVTNSKVQLQEAERLVSEAERLLKQRHISQTELAKRKSVAAQAKAQVAEAEAALDTLQETLRRHTLYAPFSGVISSKSVEVGEWISRGDAALSLTNLKQLYLDIKVPQEHVSKVTPQTLITIQPDTQPTLKLELPISTVIPVGDQQSRTLLIRTKVNAAEHGLISGTSANVTIKLPQTNNTGLIVDRDALLIHPDGGYSLFVIDENNIAHRHLISLVEMTSQGALINSNLGFNDKIVIRGNEVLNEGDSVRIEAP